MRCQNCGEREANMRYSQNINGRKKELFLCSECAKELNVWDDFSNDFDFGFGFPHMFSDLFGNLGGLRLMEMPQILNMYIPLTENSHAQKDYYDRTNPELDEALKKITSKNKGLSKKAKLEKELQECIRLENYERAAEIRDELKRME